MIGNSDLDLVRIMFKFSMNDINFFLSLSFLRLHLFLVRNDRRYVILSSNRKQIECNNA